MNNKEITFMDALISRDFSGAIERSEKREQIQVVKNQRLPIKSNDHSVPLEVRKNGITMDMEFEERFKIMGDNNKKWTKAQYEKMGISIVDEYDDLFLNVILPNGWEVKPTTHSMWNDVFDEKGRKRISFFYKGAFYDRESFSNFEKRFTFNVVPFDEYKTDATYEERNSKEWYGIVYDCNKEIFRSEGKIKEDYYDESLEQICIGFLNINYRNWQDINAYWND